MSLRGVPMTSPLILTPEVEDQFRKLFDSDFKYTETILEFAKESLAASLVVRRYIRDDMEDNRPWLLMLLGIMQGESPKKG